MNLRILHWLLPLAGAAALHAAVALAWLGAAARTPVIGGANGDGIELSLTLTGGDPVTAPDQAAQEPVPQPPAPPTPAPPPRPKLQPAAAAKVQSAVQRVSERALPEPLAASLSTGAPEAAPATGNDGRDASTATSTAATASSHAGAGGPKSRFAGKLARNVRGYFGQIAGWIDANKDYPVECKKARQQGTVVVKFTLGRNGELLASAIKQSSGHTRLDQAALDTLARAAPFPPIPDFVGRDTLSIAVPIDYTLITD
ncbi:MAG: energy transducer TonB [Pseudomonadales bacterium]|nr:energy transducer TonB [Pseudomonadales bacterium]